MAESRALTASLEDYLEAIYAIVQEKQVARAKDISARLKVNKSSVTGALKGLASRELVNYDPYEVITLTDKGMQAAQEIARRHEALKEFFAEVLALDPKKAEENACRIEHAIGKQALERLIAFIEFVQTCPRGGTKWLRGFENYCKGSSGHECEQCIALLLEEIRKTKE